MSRAFLKNFRLYITPRTVLFLRIYRTFVDKWDSVNYNVGMGAMNEHLITFLKEIMRRRRKLPSQFAADIGVSHTSVSRWLSGKDLPSPQSCKMLADYAAIPLERVLSIVGYLPWQSDLGSNAWPHFREYAERKYPDELDDDLITMIEDLIERRRDKYKHGH